MRLNKLWRFARDNQTLQIQETCKIVYERQKKITATLINRKKSQWEREKIQETWKDGKLFWNMIRELLGKNREEDEEMFIYDEEGEGKEITEIPEKFVGNWVYNIYQKLLR